MLKMTCLAGVVLVAGLLAGCTSFDRVKFSDQVQKWAPRGMTAEKAQSVMEDHGFEVTLVSTNTPFNSSGPEYLDCEKTEVFFHSWTAQILLKDGKVSGYGDTTVE